MLRSGADGLQITQKAEGNSILGEYGVVRVLGDMKTRGSV